MVKMLTLEYVIEGGGCWGNEIKLLIRPIGEVRTYKLHLTKMVGCGRTVKGCVTLVEYAIVPTRISSKLNSGFLNYSFFFILMFVFIFFYFSDLLV